MTATGPSVRRVSFDVGGQVALRVLNALLRVVATALLVRGLGEERFGEWSTVLALIGLTSPIVDLSLESVVVRRIAAARDEEEAWLGTLLVVRAALSVVGFGLALAAVALTTSSDPELMAVALVFGLSYLVGLPGALRPAFTVRVRNTVPMVTAILATLVWTGGVVLLGRGEASLTSYALVFVLSEAVAMAVTTAIVLRHVRPRLHDVRRRATDLVRVGVPFSIAGLLVLAYARIDQVLVFELRGAAEAGQYAAAYRMLEQSHLVPVSISAVVLPLLAATDRADAERWGRLMQVSLEAMLVVSLGVLAVVGGAADAVVRLVYGDAFAPSAEALPVLLGAFVLISLGYLAGNLVLVLDLQRRYIAYAAAGLVANVALNLALVPRYGFVAAAWATLLTEVVVVGLTWRAALRRTTWRPALGRPARAAVAAAATAGAIVLVDRAGGGIVPQLATGAVLYPALLLLLRGVDLAGLRSLASRSPV